LPPEVYWRRRVVALAALLLAGVVLYYLIRGALSGDDSEPTPTPSPSPSTSTSTACGVADLLIDLSPTNRYFGAAEFPSFEATVTHKGLAECILDPQAPGTELLITSGADRIWSSADCGDVVFDDPSIVLAPDQTVTLTTTWPRIRSNESCQSGLNTPLPGTYHSLLTLGGAESSDGVFTLSE
jgi:hypothetical protein